MSLKDSRIQNDIRKKKYGYLTFKGQANLCSLTPKMILIDCSFNYSINVQKTKKFKNKPAFVCWKYISWVAHIVGQFFRSVCTLKFQAYGHGNSYQYSKAIQDGGDIQKRASAVKQSSKSSGLTHAHQTVCHLSQCLNGTKSKVVDASGWSALLRYCTRALFRQLQHWLHCVKANQRGKWREQSRRTHTMHKWQRSDGGGERWCSRDFKGGFWDTRPGILRSLSQPTCSVNNFIISELD